MESNKEQKKNTETVDSLLSQIKQLYEWMSTESKKAILLKKSFEDRYLDSIKNRTDLKFFLKGELDFAQKLSAEIEGEAQRRAAFKERHDGSFVDSVLGDLKDRISKYAPHPGFHSSAEKEVTLLYGALYYFIEHYWDLVAYFLRGTSLGIEVDRMERALSDVYNRNLAIVPSSVQAYNDMLRENVGTNAERIRGSQEALRLAGVWLNRLSKVLRAGCNEFEPSDEVLEALGLVDEIIEDFRLSAFQAK